MGNYRLELTDAFDYVQTIAEGSIDAFISDLPYGTTQLTWDVVPDLERLWREVYRVCKPSAVQVMFSAQPFSTDLINSNRKRFRYPLVWAKTMPTGFLDANRKPLRCHEDILIFAETGRTTYNPQMTKGVAKGYINRRSSANHYNSVEATWTVNNGERYPVSVLDFGLDPRTGGQHPTQKPLELLCYLVKTYTNPGDTVLDLFAGSGTTLAACLHTGRKAIGCEIDPQYHSVALRRLEAIEAQQSLFTLT